jgi:MobL relaxases
VRVVFHIISTGGGAGAGRVTRYIAERDKDLEREGPGSRPLFSDEREQMTYRAANRVLDPDGAPQKDDLLHLSVSFEEADFEKLGKDEQERQARLREIIRAGMKGMAEELNVERLNWVAGIHRNSDNPHAHIVVHKQAVERNTGADKRIGRIPKRLLPHKEMQQGREVIVPGLIGDRFLIALDKQQALYLSPEHPQTRARQGLDELIERMRSNGRESTARGETVDSNTQLIEGRSERQAAEPALPSFEQQSIARSWRADTQFKENYSDLRLSLGRQIELSIRLRFAQVWYDRAVEHGDTYRFNVVDQSITEERKISELDVHRRAAARAQHFPDRLSREQAYEADLSRHRETLDELREAREAKIAAQGKDLSALRSKVGRADASLAKVYEGLTDKDLTPVVSRSTLSELQEQAVKLNLPETVLELENLRVKLAREHDAPVYIDQEAAGLVAQLNVARADFMARDKRLENFEASVHLATYEVGDERWSLAALDKQITRRREDAKIIPERAARLDLRSLAHINYSAARRDEAAIDVQHLTFIRGEIVSQIEQRREPLVAYRDLAVDLVDVLQNAYSREERARERRGVNMPAPIYQPDQMKTLEASAETLRDTDLLREVHEWEKAASQSDRSSAWEGRAVAREIMAGLAVEETRSRLERFLESQKVASLHLGDHRTGTLREVEAPNAH